MTSCEPMVIRLPGPSGRSPDAKSPAAASLTDDARCLVW